MLPKKNMQARMSVRQTEIGCKKTAMFKLYGYRNVREANYFPVGTWVRLVTNYGEED